MKRVQPVATAPVCGGRRSGVAPGTWARRAALTALSTVLLLWSPGRLKAWHIRGCVLEDVNRSDAIDGDDSPVEGIRVVVRSESGTFTGSDRTGVDGCYYIRLPDAPDDYTAVLDESTVPAGARIVAPAAQRVVFSLTSTIIRAKGVDWLIATSAPPDSDGDGLHDAIDPCPDAPTQDVSVAFNGDVFVTVGETGLGVMTAEVWVADELGLPVDGGAIVFDVRAGAADPFRQRLETSAVEGTAVQIFEDVPPSVYTLTATLEGVPGCWDEASAEVVVAVSGPALPAFCRGDPNDTGVSDISDVFDICRFLVGRSEPACAEAAEVNGDGLVDLSDALFELQFVVGIGAPPVAPGPVICGLDLDPAGSLGCESYTSCPR